MTETELLVDCLRRLEGSGLPSMFVGPMTGNDWGVPRSTHDIDFDIEYELEDVEQIHHAFGEDFLVQEISVRSGLKPPHQFNALDNRSALKVDFIRVPDDAYERKRFSRRRRVELFGQTASIATAEDVLLHKLRWHTISPTERQLNDASGIFAVSRSDMDVDYMKRWVERIGVTALLEPIMESK